MPDHKIFFRRTTSVLMEINYKIIIQKNIGTKKVFGVIINSGCPFNGTFISILPKYALRYERDTDIAAFHNKDMGFGGWQVHGMLRWD